MSFSRLFRIGLGALLALTLGLVAASAQGQQQRSTRTLFEVLFGGGGQQTQPPPAQVQTPATAQPQAAPRPAPQAAATPAPPRVEIVKSETARRIAVFGDSLAIDLARALERLYAENPEIMVIDRAVGSSGLVRDDYYDWNGAIDEAVAENAFDVAVVAIGINDRQVLEGAQPLSDAWRAAYRGRLDAFLSRITGAGKQVIWIELPPMAQPSYGAAMVQISSIHKAAVAAAGGEWIETYDRYMGENGGYSVEGPDLNGNIVAMRKSDGIHFSAAGADKVAFYVDRALGQGSGSRVSLSGSTVEVADFLAGTDAASLLRPPYQGLEQSRFIAMASVVQDLGGAAYRAGDLIVAGTQTAGTQGFDLNAMLSAPAGRVDAFGLGRVLVVVENPGGR